MSWKENYEDFFNMSKDWADKDLESYEFYSDVIFNSLTFEYITENSNNCCFFCFKRDNEILNDEIKDCIEFRIILNGEILSGVVTTTYNSLTILTDDYSEIYKKDSLGYENTLYKYSNDMFFEIDNRTYFDFYKVYKRK